MADLKDIQNRVVTIKGVKRVQIMRVRVKTNDARAIISVKNFDPHLHEQLPDEEASTATVESDTKRSIEQKAADARQAEIDQAKQITPFKKTELVEMTIEALKMLPEWNKIPASKRTKLKDKEDVINALIEYR